MNDTNIDRLELSTTDNLASKVTVEAIVELLAQFIDGTSYYTGDDIKELHTQLDIEYGINFLILTIHDTRLGEKPEAFRNIHEGIKDDWDILCVKHGFYKYSNIGSCNIDLTKTIALQSHKPVSWNAIRKTTEGKKNRVLKIAQSYGMADGYTYALNANGIIVFCSAGVSSGKVAYEQKELLDILLIQLSQVAAMNQNIFFNLELSERESTICRSILNGNTQTKIAGDLGLSTQTIRNNLEKLCRRFGVSDPYGVIARCIDLKLIHSLPAMESEAKVDNPR
ncbi:MAG: LuxR C-terminal-related transcriptional regulator [Sedimenticola sp.]